MALLFIGTTDIPTAGTRVQIDNTSRMVVSITFKARNGNTGNIYIGTISKVSSTNGFELRPNEAQTFTFPYRILSVPISDFWADTAAGGNGNDVDYMAILAP